MPGRMRFRTGDRGGLRRGSAEHAATESLRKGASLGLNDELDAEYGFAADQRGAAGTGFAAEVIQPRPHLIHSLGQVAVDGDFDNVQHERDSAWGERNFSVAQLFA